MTWCGFSHQYFRTTLCLLEKLPGLPFNARTYSPADAALAGLSSSLRERKGFLLARND